MATQTLALAAYRPASDNVRPAAMRSSRFAVARSIRSISVPLVIALPPLYWVAIALQRASLCPLGRDQGIFQYIAWAIWHGAVDYRDVRDVNGPLTHLVHLAFLALGGADDRVFRVLDLTATGLSFAFVGACLPGWSTRPRWFDRLAWALAGWVVLSSQYLLYDFWHSAQRESFFDWFMLPSAALAFAAQSPYGARSRKARLALLAAAGALSIVPWFGKPTYGFFTVALLLPLLLERRSSDRPSRLQSLLAFAAGGFAAAALQLGVLGLFGDVGAYVRIQLIDVPAMYRFIWPRALSDVFSGAWCGTQAVLALGGSVLVLGLIALGEIPARALGLALLPLCALGSVAAQGKGFPYHFHPVTAAISLQWLLLASWLTERTRTARRDRRLLRVVPIAAAAVLSLHVASGLVDSPYVRAVWLLWGAATPEQRATEEYFKHFPEPDFFPYELRLAAAYVQHKTAPTDRVQIYGMDPYLLFLAGRASASPYIYAYDLNADAALSGSAGGGPDAAQAERIRELRSAHEADLLQRLEKSPPATFVFIDSSPLLTLDNAWEDFASHCTGASAWVATRYHETARFGHDHVWLRNDLALDVPPSGVPDDGPAGSPP